MEYIFGELDLNKGKFNNMSDTLQQYSTARYEIILMGDIWDYDTDKPLDGLALIELYEKLGNNFNNKINGVHSLCILDKKNNILRISQDFMGGATYLYYTVYDNVFIFSSSLIKLLERRGAERKYNKAKEWFFLYNGFLLGKDTMLQDIFKLTPNTCLTIVAGKIMVQTNMLQLEELSEKEGTEQLQQLLDRSIRKHVEHGFEDNKISMALSAGYDSNYILHYVTSQFPHKISAFCVGGSHGVNEINNVINILQYYDNVQLNEVIVSHDFLRAMPDIVERLEGAVYERGIFLQYALAKNINSNKISHLLCGECADQVFNQNFYEESSKDTYLYGYRDNPYEMGSYLVLKKNGILLNSFGIRGLYPFLDYHVMAAGKALGRLNSYDKQFYRLKCQKVLPEKVMAYINKQGGSTSLEALFASQQEQYQFINNRKKDEIYSPDFRISQKYSENESILEYFMCIYYLEWFKKLFIGS